MAVFDIVYHGYLTDYAKGEVFKGGGKFCQNTPLHSMNLPVTLSLSTPKAKRFQFTRPCGRYTSWHSTPFPHRKQNVTFKRTATTSTKCFILVMFLLGSGEWGPKRFRYHLPIQNNLCIWGFTVYYVLQFCTQVLSILCRHQLAPPALEDIPATPQRRRGRWTPWANILIIFWTVSTKHPTIKL